MTDIADAVADVVARFQAAGVRATPDLADVNPPAVIVRAPAIAWRFKTRDWEASWTAHAVVNDAPGAANLLNLGDLLDQVQSAMRGAAMTARPVTVVMPDGAELPAYEITWADRIRTV